MKSQNQAAALAAPPSNLPALVHEDEAFELMDREDEAQILAELSGRVVESYIYEPKYRDGTPMKNERGEPVIGLSFSGVNWACREFSKRGEAIRIVSKPEIQPDPLDPEYVIVSVVAQRFAVNTENGKEIALDSSVGVKRQWTKMAKKDKSVVVDPFWAEKATSKAQRNARKSLIPEDFVKQIIKRALEVKRNPKAAASSASKPAAVPKPAPAAKAPPAAAAPAAKAHAAATTSAKPATGAPAAKPAAAAPSPIGALRQRFWVVLKRAVLKAGQKDDEPTCRRALVALTGKEKVSDLDEPLLKKLGTILNGVAEGVAVFEKRDNGLCIIDQTNGEVRWPEDPTAEVLF